MLTLAIDTASEFGSIALVDDDRVLEEISLRSPEGFGQTLFSELEALLARQNARLADVDLYAAASGPGSFTGVRIGLAAIKGMAEVAGKPAVGISNLEALAEFGTRDLRAPVIDARRGEVYAAVFDREGIIIPATVGTFPAFLALVENRPVEWISADFNPEHERATEAPRELAAAIARLAIRRYRADEPCDPASIEANYVRRSDAEILWKA